MYTSDIISRNSLNRMSLYASRLKPYENREKPLDKTYYDTLKLHNHEARIHALCMDVTNLFTLNPVSR